MSTTNKAYFYICGAGYDTAQKKYVKVGSYSGPYYPKALKPLCESVATPTSGRDLKGVMHVSFLKDNLRRLEIELPPYNVSDSNYNGIIAKVQGKVYFIKYYDPYALAEREICVYTSTN